MHDIIDGLLTSPKIIGHKAVELGMDIDDFYVLIFDIENTGKPEETNTDEDYRFVSNVRNLLVMALKGYDYYIVPVKRHRLCSLISLQKPSRLECKKILMEICNEVLRISESLMKFSISIGISNAHGSIAELASAYSEALKALPAKNCNADSIGILTQAEDKDSHPLGDRLLPCSGFEQILNGVQGNNESSAIIRKVISTINSLQVYSQIQVICYVFLEWLYPLKQILLCIHNNLLQYILRHNYFGIQNLNIDLL